jgi:hypothetical protein
VSRQQRFRVGVGILMALFGLGGLVTSVMWQESAWVARAVIGAGLLASGLGLAVGTYQESRSGR